MRWITAVLLCGMLLFACISCRHDGAVSSSTITDSSASTSNASRPSSSTIQIKLNRLEQHLTDDNGRVLVNYIYDQPIVTLSDYPAAQKIIQADLDKLLQEQVISYAKKTLLPQAEEAEKTKDTALPYFVQMNLSIQRTDQTVISLVTDLITYAGGAHNGDYRSAKNYRTDSGQSLTFAMLGDQFRSTAIKLVTAQADSRADSLFDNYQDNIRNVVLDGTEDAKEVYGIDSALTPTFYLTNNNIIFISREYELQSYAAGIIEFPISYSAFGTALNQAYLPNQAKGSNQLAKSTKGTPTDTKETFQPKDFLVRAGKLKGNGWTLNIPKKWGGKVYVALKHNSATFYENGCHSEIGSGWLFTVEAYEDESYLKMPDYELLSIDGNIRYVALYPTDVQFEGASNENAQRYSAFSNQVEDVLHTFTLSN